MKLPAQCMKSHGIPAAHQVKVPSEEQREHYEPEAGEFNVWHAAQGKLGDFYNSDHEPDLGYIQYGKCTVTVLFHKSMYM